jgi:hypothetical protein
MEKMKFLGSSKVTGKGNIRLVTEAANILDAKDGDHILFYEEKGKIVITKG